MTCFRALVLAASARSSVAEATEWQNLTAYHIAPPAFAGVKNKDTGDAEGIIDWIVDSFDVTPDLPHFNDEACMACTVFEEVRVEFDGDWGDYRQCFAPKASRNETEYHCIDDKNESRVGRKGQPDLTYGHWFSFPSEGEDVHWREVNVTRRFPTLCLGEAWRQAAGGCTDCGATDIDGMCVGSCVRDALNITSLLRVFNNVVQDATLCPDNRVPSLTAPALLV